MIKGLIIKLIITFVLFCVTGFMLLITKYETHNATFSDDGKELFIPALKRLNSIDKLSIYADSVYASLHLPKFDTSKYVRTVSGTVKRRFYHGLSNYSLSENWISSLLGKICWTHISAIVDPDDILKYSEGLCSQQNIVFMQVLKNKGITTRTVGLGTIKGPGHFLCEVRYGNGWHLYDVDLEPNWKIAAEEEKHESLQYLLKNKDLLYDIYENRISMSKLTTITSNVTYGTPNDFPARNMLLFHKVTKALTYLLPFFFLFMFFWYYRKYKAGL